MNTREQEKQTYELFRVSVLLKGAISLAEVLAGVAALFVSPSMVATIATLLTQGELAEEPKDALANYLLGLVQHYSVGLSIFIAFYLVSRGAIKLLLVIALLKNKLWAYPLSLVVLELFVIYQLYQIMLARSPIVIGITLFDLVVMYFIWREYRVVQKHRRAQGLIKGAETLPV